MAQQAARDANQVTTLLGAYNGSTTRLLVEHATGYLKVSVVPTVLSAPSVTPAVAEKDDNNVSSLLGAYNGAVKPLMATNSGNYLRVVIA